MKFGDFRRNFGQSGSGDGVGDDLASFAYDGWRHKVWNAALPGGHRDYASDSRWSAGSVVGCLLDWEQEGGAISFSLDGEFLGVAFTGLREQLSRAGHGAARGLCPAATFTAGRHELRFGSEECAHVPEGYSLFARPPNRFDVLAPGCALLPAPATAAEGEEGGCQTLWRQRPAAEGEAGVMCATEPLLPITAPAQWEEVIDGGAALGYFEVTVLEAGEAGEAERSGDDGESEPLELWVGVGVAGGEPAPRLGGNIDSIGYGGTPATIRWDGAGPDQLLPSGADHPQLPAFDVGDVVGCGLLLAEEEDEEEGVEGLGVELPSFLRVFWTKNGELLCMTADAIPARSEKGPWHPVRFLTEVLDDFRRFVGEIWRF